MAAHYASLIGSQTVQCECYNETSQNHCKSNVTVCPTSDSSKPQACFVLWTRDNKTNEHRVTMKGCFADDSCNQTECIDNSPARLFNFCCCLGSMCNANFMWSPTTAKPIQPEERGNFSYFFLNLVTEQYIIVNFYSIKKKFL